MCPIERKKRFNHENIVEDWNKGMSAKEIAKNHSCTKTTIGNILRKHKDVKLRFCKCGCGKLARPGCEIASKNCQRIIHSVRRIIPSVKRSKIRKRKDKLIIKEKLKVKKIETFEEKFSKYRKRNETYFSKRLKHFDGNKEEFEENIKDELRQFYRF